MPTILVSLAEQKLAYWSENTCHHYPIISSHAGEKENSFCTPRGQHIIIEKIGDNLPYNTIFVSRQPSGIYTDDMQNTKDDFILSRILRLSGMNQGLNLGEGIDSLGRYIYIHGTPDNQKKDQRSHGCLRMSNTDIIHLFNLVPLYTMVWIVEGKLPHYPVHIDLFTHSTYIKKLLSPFFDTSCLNYSTHTKTLIAFKNHHPVGFLQCLRQHDEIHCISMHVVDRNVGIETQLLNFLLSKAYLFSDIKQLIWRNPSTQDMLYLEDNHWQQDTAIQYSKELNHSHYH